MAAPSLRINFSWALAGNLTYSAAQFVALILLARLGSTEVVGRYTLGLSIAGPVLLLSNLKLRQVQATDQGGQYSFADYAGLRLVTAPLSMLVVAAIALGTPGYPAQTMIVVALVGVSKGFEAVSDVAHGQFLRHEHHARMAWSQITRGGTLILAIAVGLGVLGSLPAAVALQGLGWAGLAAWDLVGAGRLEPEGWRPRWHGPTLRAVAGTAFPLGLAVAVGSLELNVPRYVLEGWHGESALGVFAAVAYLLVAQSLVISALGLAVSPRLAQYWASGDRPAFRSLLWRLVLGGAGIGLASVAAAAAVGRPLLALLFGAEYADASDILVRLMGAAAITSSFVFLGTAINAMRLFRLQAPIQATSLAVATVLSILWIPEQGAMGAANALIGAALTSLVLYGLTTTWLLRQPVAGPPTDG